MRANAKIGGLDITTTPSYTPLLFASQVRPGMHITAVGADSPGKQELDPHILGKADLVIVDSRSQCVAYGETHHAFTQSLLHPSKIHELGEVIAGTSPERSSDQQMTIVDLTGLAAKFFKYLLSLSENHKDHPPVIIFAHSQGSIIAEHALALMGFLNSIYMVLDSCFHTLEYLFYVVQILQ